MTVCPQGSSISTSLLQPASFCHTACRTFLYLKQLPKTMRSFNRNRGPDHCLIFPGYVIKNKYSFKVPPLSVIIILEKVSLSSLSRRKSFHTQFLPHYKVTKVGTGRMMEDSFVDMGSQDHKTANVIAALLCSGAPSCMNQQTACCLRSLDQTHLYDNVFP